MTSTQRFLANNRNVLLNATLAATSVATIADAVLERPQARTGSAHVALSGAYTGPEEANYEIEITDTIVTTPIISQPVFAGAGTGDISAISYTGTAQEITVKLADLGQVLTSSGTDIEGVSIVARNPGAAGNLIHLSVDQSGLVFANSDFSTIQPIKTGADGEEGPQFDWDTKIMGADGQIPSDAHRLSFGEDTSTVYRQYKVYKGGKWLYHFEPAIKNEIQAGTRIKFVSGGRTVTLTDGTTTETYPGIVSLYDLLSAFQTTSSLVKVSGVVANDRSPGGMAARDLVTRTDAHCLPSTGQGSAFATGMINCSALALAKTELVEARCWAVTSKDSPDAGIGRELWQVKGSVSGLVSTALKTGVAFSTDQFALTIPTKLPDGFGVQRGRFSQTAISYAARNTAGGEIEPPICVKQSLALGPEAVDQSLTLVYKARPAAGNCNCDDMAVPDLSGRECLTGKIDLTEEGDNTMTPAQMGRLSRIGAWHRDAVDGNISMSGGGSTSGGASGYVLSAARKDIELAGLIRDAFSLCLDDLYTSGTLMWAEWTTATLIPRYSIIQIGDSRLMARTAGTTGATQPTVPATVGGTVVDGTVTWELLGKTPEVMWDEAMDSVLTDFNQFMQIGQSVTFPVGSVDLSTTTFGQVIPSGTTVYGTAQDQNIPPGLTYNSKAILTANLTVGSTTPIIYANGTETIGASILVDAVAATWGGIQAATFSDIIWAWATPEVGPGMIDQVIYIEMKDIAQRYTASMDAIRAAAGITKKADASTKVGDGCWRDNGDAYWWEITGSVGGEYAPVFNNTPYIASRRTCTGEYFSTHEFGFQINVKCPESLKVGDQITLSIGDAGWPSTYQVGDTLYLPVIAAQDLYLAGGHAGDNIQTWHVDGSVNGAFPAYLNDLDAPMPYSAAGLQFQIDASGIPFEAGDLFKFAIEGGNWRWRKDGGAWSAASAIPASLVSLSDGLSATFSSGAAPSFAAGDLHSFRALQPAALSNVVNPDVESWKWSGASATLTANLGTEESIDCAALAFHTLPAGAVVAISGGVDGVIWDWTEAIPWRLGTMATLFSAHPATWLKIDIANADGGAIGWIWAGAALSTEYSAECQLRRDYAVERGAGLNPSAAFMGATRSGSIEWTEAALSDTDMTKLLDLLDHLKSDDDAPMILIPHYLRPAESWPVRVVMDEVDYPETWSNQPNDGTSRRYSLKLPVKGVMA